MRTLGRARTYECQVFVTESSLTRVKSDPDSLARAYATRWIGGDGQPE